MELAFQALANMAFYITATDDEVDAERPVVMEEWRQRQVAAMRNWFEAHRRTYEGSLYAERLPIGLPETVQGTPAARVRDYLRQHYLPQHMALVVVGDVPDKRVLDALLQKAFVAGAPTVLDGTVSDPPDLYPPLPVAPPVPSHAELRYVLLKDPETTHSQAKIVVKHADIGMAMHSSKVLVVLSMLCCVYCFLCVVLWLLLLSAVLLDT